MSDLQVFFNERKQEVNTFIKFIKIIEEEPTYSSEIKILKSQAILMLYNLIEGTVNKGISSIFDKINDNSLKHDETSEQIRIMWFRYFKLHLDDQGGHLQSLSSIDSFISTHVNIDINQFRENNPSYFKAGTLDSGAIKIILKKFAIDFNSSEYKLQEIKKERNSLAHGEKSFTEIGHEKSVRDVRVTRVKVIKFLKLYVTEIEQYISNQSYKAQS